MKISVQKDSALFTALIVYFTSKILWDKLVPNVFELVSILVLTYGALKFIGRKIDRKYMWIVLIYVLLVIYVLINALIQDSTRQLTRALYEYCFYFFMIFGMSYYIGKFRNLGQIDKCLKFVNIWGLLIAILSWYEYFSRSYILGGNFRQTIMNAYGFRAAVFTRSYLSHAIILAFFALIALYLYMKFKERFFLFSFVGQSVSILTTSSRGPLVALVISIIVFYILDRNRQGVHLSKKLITIMSVLIFALFAWWFLNSSFVTGNDTIDYFLYRTRQIINWTSDAGNLGRISIWKNTFSYIQDNVFFGIGPSQTGSWGSESIGVTESGWLKYLCELGVIGIAILIAFLASIIKLGVNQYKTASSQYKLFMILCFSCVTLLTINNITLQSSEEIQVMFIWAFGFGGLLSKTDSVIDEIGGVIADE